MCVCVTERDRMWALVRNEGECESVILDVESVLKCVSVYESVYVCVCGKNKTFV